MLLKKQSGMTLIEVLIASIILFMAIGLVTSAFLQSLLLQRKVIKQREKIELIQIVKPMIQFEVNQGEIAGHLDILSEKIDWQAELVAKERFVDSLAEDSEYVSGLGNMALYKIIVKQGNAQILIFKHVVWRSS